MYLSYLLTFRAVAFFGTTMTMTVTVCCLPQRHLADSRSDEDNIYCGYQNINK